MSEELKNKSEMVDDDPKGKIAGLVVQAYGIGANDIANKGESNAAKKTLVEMGLDIYDIEHAHPKPPLGIILDNLKNQWEKQHKGDEVEE